MYPLFNDLLKYDSVKIGTMDIYKSQNKFALLGFHREKKNSPVKQDDGITYIYIYAQVDSLWNARIKASYKDALRHSNICFPSCVAIKPPTLTTLPLQSCLRLTYTASIHDWSQADKNWWIWILYSMYCICVNSAIGWMVCTVWLGLGYWMIFNEWCLFRNGE